MSLTLINQAAIREVDLDDLNVVKGAKITVRNKYNNNIAPLYNTDDLLDPKPNPFFADDVGQIEFFIDDGLYNVKALSVSDLNEIEGSVNFQVKSAIQNIKTPEDYGYTGSGDETAIIQNYMNSESTWFFPNEYTVNSKLTVTDRKITCIPAAGKIISTILNDTVIEFVRCNDSVVDGFNLDMSAINTAEYEDAFHDCFRVNNSKRFTMSNCQIVGAPVQAVNFLYGCTESKIIGNTIYDSGRKKRILPGSGISIGGGLIVFNSARCVIANNIISRSWSACIYYYGNITDNPTISDQPEKSVIEGNVLHYSQSNGLRIQDDNYPDSTGSRDCSVIGNVIVDVARSCIRPNGLNHTVTGNVCIYTGNEIYGVLNLEPDGIASNHCLNGVWSSNIFNGVGVGMFLVPNNLANYGCENLTIDNNRAVDCSYLIARAGETAAKVENINVSNCYSNNPVRTHAQMFNTGKITFSNCEFFGVGQIDPNLPAFRFSDNTRILIDRCSTDTVRDSVNFIRCNYAKITNCDFKSKVNGIGTSSTKKMIIQNNEIEFNTDNLSGASGITANNADYIRIDSNEINSPATSSSSALLIANTDETDPANPVTPTIGHVKGNTFDTVLGINNQTNQFDGDQFQQIGNIFIGNPKEFDTDIDAMINRSSSYTIKPEDSGKTVVFSASGQILNIPAGLKVGYRIYLSLDISISATISSPIEIIRGPTISAGSQTILLKKINSTSWISSAL